MPSVRLRSEWLSEDAQDSAHAAGAALARAQPTRERATEARSACKRRDGGQIALARSNSPQRQTVPSSPLTCRAIFAGCVRS
jgi:hypothetical protein